MTGLRKRSPATQGGVNRAITDRRGSHSRGILYHGMADLVENNPTAHPVEVYAGRECIGTVVQVRREHHAFGLNDIYIDVFGDRREASRAVKRHHESSRALAS